MAAALPAMMVAGTAISAIGALNAGNADAAAAERNAQMNARAAGISLQQGEAAAVQQGQINYRRLSGIKAAVGASGLTMDGSPLDILESSAAQAELDTQNIRYNARLKSLGFGENADMDRDRAQSARKGGIFQAAATSLVGGARAYGMRGTGTPVPGLRSDDYFAGADMAVG